MDPIGLNIGSNWSKYWIQVGPIWGQMGPIGASQPATQPASQPRVATPTFCTYAVSSKTNEARPCHVVLCGAAEIRPISWAQQLAPLASKMDPLMGQWATHGPMWAHVGPHGPQRLDQQLHLHIQLGRILWWSNGGPMVVQWWSSGGPMVVQWWSMIGP